MCNLKNEFLPYLNSMEESTIKTYIQQRILEQLTWYDKKSSHFQNQFKALTVCSIILSTSIPVIVLFDSNKYFFWKVLISIVSAVVTVITGLLSLSKSKELWLEYRNSCELLKSLLHKYFTDADIFSNKEDSEKNELLISTCENIITHEIKNWVDTYKKKANTRNQSSTSS